MLRVGIISANWGAYAHLPAWRALPGVEVTAICTSRQETAEAAGQRLNIDRAFWDAEQMAADPEIDIIDCGTRPNVRHSMVLAALRNGKHVYNGIPFAASFDAARELRDAWQASGRVALVDAFAQWLPVHRMAKEMLDAGYLGQPFAGTCTFNLGMFNQPDPRFPYNWFWQDGLGVSAMRNLGSHASHVLLHLFGEIEEVVAVESRLLDAWHFPDGTVIHPQTNDFANALLRFRNGMLIQLQVSWSAALTPGWTLEAFGSKGRISVKAPTFPTCRDTVLYAGSIDGDAYQQVEIPERLLRTDGIALTAEDDPQPSYPMALAMQSMVNAIQGQSGEPRPDFGQAWEVERLLESIRRSAIQRRWVRLDEVV